METSLGAHENQWPELAFDGSADTFFWADRDLRKDVKAGSKTRAKSTARLCS